jgi:hypothetical protein
MYGWGTFVCQDCRGKKKTRNSKRCKPCNYKSKEFAEIESESQTTRFEDPAEREKLRIARKKQYEDPAAHVKTSEALKKYYEDPKEREKRRKAIKESKKFQASRKSKEFRKKMSEATRRSWMKRKKVGGGHGDQIS